MKKKIIISSGNHNYHMIFTASEIDKRKKLKLLLCGPYPTRLFIFFFKKFKFLNPVNKIFNRSDKININRVRPIWISEIIEKLKNYFSSYLFNSIINKIEFLSFELFQNSSLKVLKNINLNNVKIFHFRSGYGGICIDYIKNKKIITLCDHAIVHPKIIDYLVLNKGKFPTKINNLHLSNFWKLVNQDLNKSDYFLVNSDFVKKTFIKMKIKSNKIFVIPQGIENKFLQFILKKKIIKRGKLKILFSGSLSTRKGIFDLQESLKYLKNCDLEIHLAGELKNQIKPKLDKLLNNKKVIYHGILSKKRLALLMLNSQIFVFPSYAEGSARVIFEAMACGCVIITTENSGSIVKNRINGTIIKPGEPNQIANAIKYYKKNMSLISNISTRNKYLIKNKYNQKIYGEKLFKIYNKFNG